MSYIGLSSPLSFLFPHLPPPPLLLSFLLSIWYFVIPFLCVLFLPTFLGLSLLFLCYLPSPSLFLVVGSDLKDIQNNKNRYLIASENQRPGHFSTAPIGSLTASPSSGSLCSQGGLQSVTSIQERIMSTPGGEEAIERLKVKQTMVYAALLKSHSLFVVRKVKSPAAIFLLRPLKGVSQISHFIPWPTYRSLILSGTPLSVSGIRHLQLCIYLLRYAIIRKINIISTISKFSYIKE